MEEDPDEGSKNEDEGEENAPVKKKKWALIALLFAVIIIEGYVVLASELLVIRQTQ